MQSVCLGIPVWSPPRKYRFVSIFPYLSYLLGRKRHDPKFSSRFQQHVWFPAAILWSKNQTMQCKRSPVITSTRHCIGLITKAMVFTSGEIRIGPHLENSNGIFMHDPFVSPRTWSRKQYYCWFTGGIDTWPPVAIQGGSALARHKTATGDVEKGFLSRYEIFTQIFDDNDICISWTSMFYPLLLPSTKMLVMRKLLKIPSMDGTDGRNWYPQSGTGDVGPQVVCSSCSGSLHVVMDNGLVAQTSLRMIFAYRS